MDLDALPDDDRCAAKFYTDFTQAEAEGEAELVSVWRDHTADDWKAAQKLLASRHRDRWGEKQTVEITTPVQTVDLTKLSPEELEAMLDLLRRADNTELAQQKELSGPSATPPPALPLRATAKQ